MPVADEEVTVAVSVKEVPEATEAVFDVMEVVVAVVPPATATLNALDVLVA